MPAEGITESDKKINVRFTKIIERLSTLEIQFNNQITELKEILKNLQDQDDINTVNVTLEELIKERQKIIERKTHIQSVLEGDASAR